MAVLDLNFPVIVFMNPGASREETLNALKMMGMNNVHPAGNFMACREMMRHKPNAMLVLDWQGEETVSVLNFSRGSLNVDPRPIVMIVEEEPDYFLNVMSDYHLTAMQPGPVSTTDMIRLFNDFFEGGRLQSVPNVALTGVNHFRAKGDHEGALNLLRDLQLKSPKNYKISLEIVDVLISRGSWQDATAMVGDVLLNHPDNPRALHLQARCLLQQRRPEDAARLLSQSTLLNPMNCDRLVDLGDTLLRLNQPDKAAKQYDKALHLNKEHSGARVGKGTTDLLLGNSGALNFIKELASEREKAAIFNNAGIVNINLGHLDEAIRLYDVGLKLLSSPPLQARVTFNKSLAWLRDGRPEEAIKMLKKAMALDGKFTRAGILLEKIKGGARYSAARVSGDDYEAEDIETVLGNDLDESF